MTRSQEQGQVRQVPVRVRMRALLPTLGVCQRRVAEIFLADPAGSAHLSISDLARRAHTSTTTVVRFHKHLGYQRLQDLRLDLLGDVVRDSLDDSGVPEVAGDIDRFDTLAQIVAKVSQAETMSIADSAAALDLAALEKAVDVIDLGGRIDIFGVGASSFVGMDLHLKLTRIGRTAVNWVDTHAAWMAAATRGPGDLVIAISHSGETYDTAEFVKLARHGGATAIAVTNNPNSVLAHGSDIVLGTVARETDFRSGALGSRTAALMVVDCLFVGVAQRQYDQTMRAVRATYSAVRASSGRASQRASR